MSRNSGGKRGPALVGSLLGGLSTGGRGDPRLDAELWRRAVGPRIAERTTPGTLRAGTLVVRVASAAWAQELSLLSDEIRRRLGEAGIDLKEIRFRVDRGAAGDRSAARAPAPAAPRPAPLPVELVERIGEIEDPELRTVIAQAARHSLALDATRAPSAKPRGAPGPRSAGSGSDRPAQARREPTAASRRRRGGPRG